MHTQLPLRLVALLWLTIAANTTTAHAFSREEAYTHIRHCMSEAIVKFSARESINHMIDFPRLTSKAVGPPFRHLKRAEQQLLIDTAQQIFATDFIEASSREGPSHISIDVTTLKSSHFRVSGSVTGTWNGRTMSGNYMALLRLTPGGSCLFSQMRSPVTILDQYLRSELKKRSATSRFILD